MFSLMWMSSINAVNISISSQKLYLMYMCKAVRLPLGGTVHPKIVKFKFDHLTKKNKKSDG